MKREDLLRYLRSQGCELNREGGAHSIGVNLQGKTQAVPRHTEIEEFLARAICRKLGLDAPGRRNH